MELHFVICNNQKLFYSQLIRILYNNFKLKLLKLEKEIFDFTER